MKITSTIKMGPKPQVADLCGEKVMVDFNKGKYFMLKGVGNDIWDLLEDNIKVETITKKLLEEYDVDRETCENSTLKFLQDLEDLGFIKGMEE